MPCWPHRRTYGSGDEAAAFETFRAFHAEGAEWIATRLAKQEKGDAELIAAIVLLEAAYQLPLAGDPIDRLDGASEALWWGKTRNVSNAFEHAFDVGPEDFSEAFRTGIAQGPRKRPARTLRKVKSDLRFFVEESWFEPSSFSGAMQYLRQLMWLRHEYQLPGTMADAITEVVDGARGASSSVAGSAAAALVDRIGASKTATWNPAKSSSPTAEQAKTTVTLPAFRCALTFPDAEAVEAWLGARPSRDTIGSLEVVPNDAEDCGPPSAIFGVTQSPTPTFERRSDTSSVHPWHLLWAIGSAVTYGAEGRALVTDVPIQWERSTGHVLIELDSGVDVRFLSGPQARGYATAADLPPLKSMKARLRAARSGKS